MTAPVKPSSIEGVLRARLVDVSERAMGRGALWPIDTHCEQLQEQGMWFALRIVDNLRRRDLARLAAQQTHTQGNPFLPYDPELYVGDVPPGHVVLLNKFNVLDNHALIVTQTFEYQEKVLTPGDFEALWRCLLEVNGLGFYNAGSVAGASQPHKHLQLVPFPLAAGCKTVPLQEAIDLALGDAQDGEPRRIGGWRLRHRLCRIHKHERVHESAQLLHRYYRDLLSACDLNVNHEGMCRGYNLLLTREWMMVVHRTREEWRGMSINALAFAGALLARNDQDAQAIREYGPLTVLAAVCAPE